MSSTPSIPLLEADPEGAEAARQRLAPKSKLSRLFTKKKKSRQTLHDDNHAEEEREVAVTSRPGSPTELSIPITLDASSLLSSNSSSLPTRRKDKDKYEWAIVYENQRGTTIFSTPYYSSLSLLPTDPSPFTLPSSYNSPRGHEPRITLDTYPLPDGTWSWVSRCWMIDMRATDVSASSSPGCSEGAAITSGAGHDPEGFEYNWVFRRSKWRAQPGFAGSGGWVRRRRWVRLMVRDELGIKGCLEETKSASVPSSVVATPRIVDVGVDVKTRSASVGWKDGEAPIIQSPRHRHSVGSSILTGVEGLIAPSLPSSPPPPLAPSVSTPSTPSHETPTPSQSLFHLNLLSSGPDEIFQGSSPTEDWERCRALMRRFGRDGRKLECWRGWLGVDGLSSEDKFWDAEEHMHDAEKKNREREKGKRRKQWTEDEGPMPSEVKALKAKLAMARSLETQVEVQEPDVQEKGGVQMVKREYLIPVLRAYTHQILHLFVYPDSRAQFIRLLERAGVLDQLKAGGEDPMVHPNAEYGYGYFGEEGGRGDEGRDEDKHGREDEKKEKAQEKEGDTKFGAGVSLEVDFWSYKSELSLSPRERERRDTEKERRDKKARDHAVLGLGELPKLRVRQPVEEKALDKEKEEGKGVVEVEYIEDIIEERRDVEDMMDRDGLGVD